MEKGLEGQLIKEINGKGTRRIGTKEMNGECARMKGNEGDEWKRDQDRYDREKMENKLE